MQFRVTADQWSLGDEGTGGKGEEGRIERGQGNLWG